MQPWTWLTQDERKTFVVRDEDDLMHCRTAAMDLAARAGFSQVDCVRITTAVSEIVRNALTYAGGGEMVLQYEDETVTITVHDDGPGITDVEMAMRDGYSSSQSMGLGLPGAKRLMDSFDIETNAGSGTTIVMRKKRYGMDRSAEAAAR